MDKQNFLNESYEGKYPISADTFDFMQNQIEFVSQLASAFGQNVLLKRATNSKNGLIVLGGELYPLQAGTSGSYYKIVCTNVNITAQGHQYTAARTTKIVQLTSAMSPYPVSQVVDLTGRAGEDETIANQFLPKGAIIMWSGSTSSLPKGFALCDGNTVNDVVTPDLRGKFIVGQSNETEFNAIGKTGGSKTKTLTIENMPSHKHLFITDSNAEGKGSGNGMTDHGTIENASGSGTGLGLMKSTSSAGDGNAFSILPPYYVLAYIIKVI